MIYEGTSCSCKGFLCTLVWPHSVQRRQIDRLVKHVLIFCTFHLDLNYLIFIFVFFFFMRACSLFVSAMLIPEPQIMLHLFRNKRQPSGCPGLPLVLIVGHFTHSLFRWAFTLIPCCCPRLPLGLSWCIHSFLVALYSHFVFPYSPKNFHTTCIPFSSPSSSSRHPRPPPRSRRGNTPGGSSPAVVLPQCTSRIMSAFHPRRRP